MCKPTCWLGPCRLAETYRLVRAKHPQIVSVTNAACNSYSNVTLVSIPLTAINGGEGDITIFFVQGLGLALAAKMCPHRPQAFKKVENGQAFPSEFFFFHFFFLNEPVTGTPRHAYTFFRNNLRRIDCVRSIASKI